MRLIHLVTSTAALSFLASSPASAEQWRQVMEDARLVAAVDADSVRRNGDIARGWMLTVPKGKMPPGTLPALMVFDIEIDCPASLKRVVSGRMTDMAGGEVQAAAEANLQWAPITPDTPVAAMAAVLCEAKPMGARSAADAPAFARLVRPAGS